MVILWTIGNVLFSGLFFVRKLVRRKSLVLWNWQKKKYQDYFASQAQQEEHLIFYRPGIAGLSYKKALHFIHWLSKN